MFRVAVAGTSCTDVSQIGFPLAVANLRQNPLKMPIISPIMPTLLRQGLMFLVKTPLPATGKHEKDAASSSKSMPMPSLCATERWLLGKDSDACCGACCGYDDRVLQCDASPGHLQACRQVTLCLSTLARQFVNSDAVKATSLWEKKVKKDTDAKQPKQATETASKDMCKLLTQIKRTDQAVPNYLVPLSRNSFLDVEVHSGMDKASRRARSAPAECRYEDFVAEINEAKPFTRTLTDRTVSTDYRDLDSLVDTEFGRQTSQQSSFSFSEMQDSPTAGSDDTEDAFTVMVFCNAIFISCLSLQLACKFVQAL
eukprot:s1094_g6.t1